MASFVIPVWNGEEFLEETIESALAQTEPRVEVIVVDDGSTDRSLAIAEGRAGRDARLRVVRRPRSGVSRARNAGIDVSRGRYLVFLDADDLVPPDKVRSQAAVLDERQEIDVVYGESDDYVLGPGGTWSTKSMDRTFPDGEAAVLRGDCPFAIHAGLFRREAVLRVGGFAVTPWCTEDRLLHARLVLAGCRFLFVPGPRCLYRQRGDSRSRTDVGMGEGCLEMVRLLLRERPPGLRGADGALRERARWLTLCLAEIHARAGRRGAARRALLRSLRYRRGPGHLLEVLRGLLRPGRLATPTGAPEADGNPGGPPPPVG